MDLSSCGDVATCALHRDWIDVDGVEFDPSQRCDEGGTHSARPATQVNDNRMWSGQSGSLAHE